MAYDIIGDIHEQADKLHALLGKLGYRYRQGAYRHPSRTVIFVGDFIDRGPRQVESVMTARRMVDHFLLPSSNGIQVVTLSILGGMSRKMTWIS